MLHTATKTLQLFSMDYTNTHCTHTHAHYSVNPYEDGFSVESGSSQGFFLSPSQGVFPCHHHPACSSETSHTHTLHFTFVCVKLL
ncbi:hypothetical protein PGIGA_G00041410 [Pangasianodon gigas]|uniref:Uncharacterized protein n=1 Tax=Pangasianodon gigas TaxID=30993 RepID=A0ACC5X2A5_PANGG|nr:hypothetical protein [Pangasianodon gigas]